MKIPNYSKKKLRDGMTKEYKSGNSMLVNMFYCTILVLDFLQENFFPNGKGTYIIKEVYRPGATKINNAEGTNPNMVNGQRIKHYISSMPINVETNIIQVMTPEEHIEETFQNTPEP